MQQAMKVLFSRNNFWALATMRHQSTSAVIFSKKMTMAISMSTDNVLLQNSQFATERPAMTTSPAHWPQIIFMDMGAMTP